MADSDESSYLSIGEVLGILLEEFPDVTISKIRFLESQGLISPERTASGYRKFYEDDVDLLRVILTEQRQNFLPLRVIKDRLETGEIDPTGEHLRPDGTPEPDSPAPHEPTGADGHHGDDHHESAEVPSTAVAAHPASRTRTETSLPDAPAEAAENTARSDDSAGDSAGDVMSSAQLLPGVLLDRHELCAMVGMTEIELDQLVSFGVIQSVHGGGGAAMYDDDAVEIAQPACAFLRAGIDARHLRTFRTSAEREASLYEQIITPRLRHRNPESRAEALAQLRQLDSLGARLRTALTKQALGTHLKS